MRFSVAVPRWKKTQASAMLRKYRRLRRPGGLRREYKKLRSLLPGATRSHHLRKKVGVVEAAYQYICELQTALLDKFSTKGIPEDLAGVVRGKVATASDIQALALHLINNSATANASSVTRSTCVNPAPLTLPRLVAAPPSSASSPELDAVTAFAHRTSLLYANSYSVPSVPCDSLPSTSSPMHSHSTSPCGTSLCGTSLSGTSPCDTLTYQPTVPTSHQDTATSSSKNNSTSSSDQSTTSHLMSSSLSSASTPSCSSSPSSPSSSSSKPILIEEL